MGYTGEGESNFGGGFVRPTSAFLTSGYNLGVFWQLDGRAISAPGQQKALKHATDEDISGAGIALQAEITIQYLNALQTAAQVDVTRQQVSRNADFLKLAKARYEVGQATLLDVRQAEVVKGQSDVALLRATYLNNDAKLDLLRRMGVEPPAPVEVDHAERLVCRAGAGVQAGRPDVDGGRAEPVAAEPAGASIRRDLGRAGREVRVSPDAPGHRRVEWIHPGVHQR